MKGRLLPLYPVLGLIGAAIFCWPLRAQSVRPTTGDMVRVTVTALGTKQPAPPAVIEEDVIVRQDSERRPVVEWIPARGKQAGLDLAILIDDSADASLGVQFSDLASFIRSLPVTARVAVAYGSYGTARFRQDFTTDHRLAAKALRLPLGNFEETASIYQSLNDLLKRWPEGANRREVLLISDGIDLFRGIGEAEPSVNIDLQQAIDAAQRSGTTIYTLFATGAGRFHHNLFLITNGQGSLSRLAYETGGDAFFQGFQTPVGFRPFLDQLAQTLGRQYLLTFQAQTGKDAGFASLRVTSELHGVELIAPARIYVPSMKEETRTPRHIPRLSRSSHKYTNVLLRLFRQAAAGRQ